MEKFKAMLETDKIVNHIDSLLGATTKVLQENHPNAIEIERNQKTEQTSGGYARIGTMIVTGTSYADQLLVEISVGISLVNGKPKQTSHMTFAYRNNNEGAFRSYHEVSHEMKVAIAEAAKAN